jgi:hypothetical protein
MQSVLHTRPYVHVCRLRIKTRVETFYYHITNVLWNKLLILEVSIFVQVTLEHSLYENRLTPIRFEVFTAVLMNSSSFWDITPYSLLKVNRRFGRIYHLHLQGWNVSRARNKRTCYVFHAGFLFGLLFNPKDGGGMFLCYCCCCQEPTPGFPVYSEFALMP